MSESTPDRAFRPPVALEVILVLAGLVIGGPAGALVAALGVWAAATSGPRRVVGSAVGLLGVAAAATIVRVILSHPGARPSLAIGGLAAPAGMAAAVLLLVGAVVAGYEERGP